MVYTISLDDRVIPHHPIEHRDTIHTFIKLYFNHITSFKDINSLNQARAHLWQREYVYLSKTPKPNLVVKLYI